MKKPLAIFGIPTHWSLFALLCVLSLLLVTSGGAASLPHSAQNGDRAESNIGPGVPAGQKFTTSLSPLQEVPTPVGTLIGKGTGVVTLNAAETQIIVSLSYNSLGSNAIAAHIHGSATSTPGNTGPILFDLMPTGGTAGTNTATQFAITPAQVALLRQGLMYFNVHTINNSSGEIRGQIHLNDASRNFDGDGRTDYAVYRPSQGTWFILLSSTNTLHAGLWGSANDTIVPGDYDGDARTDFAVFRGGVWYIQPNTGGNSTARQFGVATDIPVPADYDKDGKTDIAVFRPSDGNWYILRSSDGSFS
ncbi:MAG: CHRD domain-containing protein, partial [Pyrinomonadaceae bacterium]